MALKSAFLLQEADNFLLGGCVLGDSLGSLRDGVFSQLSWKHNLYLKSIKTPLRILLLPLHKAEQSSMTRFTKNLEIQVGFPLRKGKFESSTGWCVASRFPWSNGPNNYRNDPVEVWSNRVQGIPRLDYISMLLIQYQPNIMKMYIRQSTGHSIHFGYIMYNFDYERKTSLYILFCW